MFLRKSLADAGRACTYFLQALFVLILLLLPPTPARAQGGMDTTGTGGVNKIVGRIYFPSGRRSDAMTVKVTLESSSSERLSVLADTNGSFIFNSMAPGSYLVTVEAGEDYETARETVVIEKLSVRSRSVSAADQARMNIPRTFNVMISLRPKRGPAAATARGQVLNAALAAVPKPAVELYEKALESAQARETKKAIEQLKAAISYYPEFALALNELGVQYMRLNDFERAKEAFRAALRIRPDDFMPLLNYGVALLETKEPTEAETYLRRAVQKNDTSWAAHMYLGIALIGLRNLDGAESELQRTLTLAGDELALPHYYLGGIYWQRRDHKRAADELEKYLRLAPKAPAAARIRATIKELRSKGDS
ncbi:MAG TPA: tetratricopeptide repeat protein [Pyrinomonadaceae bacterium]|nr:tetratricopeptide repeat protein [Pyrinomonadaceae bacterium]